MRLPVLSNRSTKQNGFTLIEFAMVMVLSGLVMAALLHIYKIYLTDRNVRLVNDRLLVLSSSLSTFQNASQRYPCPADPTLPVTSLEAGVEGIAGANPDRCLNLLLALPNPGDCTGPGGTGICRVDGQRTVYGLTVGSTDPDPVFIGAIPYRSLKSGMERGICFSMVDGSSVACDPGDDTQYTQNDASMEAAARMDTLDPWGFQMTYAVSAAQTLDGLFDTNFGVLDVKTENGDDLVSPEGTAHFVIVSHGENHLGAYNQEGVIPWPCTPGALDESENCDQDFSFTAGLRRMGEGPRYFDDTILYRAYSLSELWKFNDAATEGVAIYNAIAGGKVGIGTAAPEASLDVAGAALGENYHVPRICSEAGNCFEPTKLGVDGEGMTCPEASGPNYYAATGFAENGVTGCKLLPVPTGFEGMSCPEDQYIVAFGDGGLICRDIDNLELDP